MFTTAAPPILDIATNTEHNPRILLGFDAQYRDVQQAAATRKQVAVNKCYKLY